MNPKSIKEEFEKKFGHLGISYSLRKGLVIWFDQKLKEREKEVRKEICNAMQFHFESALNNGLDLGKEAWSDDEPRVRVRWYLDVYIPALRKGKFI